MSKENNKWYFMTWNVATFRKQTRELNNHETLLYTMLINREWELLQSGLYLTSENLKYVKKERFKYGKFEKYLHTLLLSGAVHEEIIDGIKVYSCYNVQEAVGYIYGKKSINPMENRRFPTYESNSINNLESKNATYKDIHIDTNINKNNNKDKEPNKFKDLSKLLKSVKNK